MGTELNPEYNPFVYWVGHVFIRVVFFALWRRRIFGEENIPPPGRAVIFAANHRSLADPPAVGSAVPYPIHFFAKAELFDVPILGGFLRRVNSFPVRRIDQDIGAFKRALRILEAKEALLLFPEGGRRTGAKQWKAKAGVGMFACRTGAVVVPVLVENTEKFTRLGRMTIRFGVPIEPPQNAGPEKYQEFSDTVMEKIRELGESHDRA